MRPIDADLFEKILDDGLMCACESLEVYDVNIYDVFDALANMPTLEVSVTSHGRWEQVGDNSFKCTHCGEISCCKGRYCPDCGTRMDEEDKDA